MFKSNISISTIFLLLQFLSPQECSVSPGCNLPGLCHDVTLDQRLTTSLDSCVLEARLIPKAEWVSFNRDVGVCTVFQECSSLDDTAQGTVSSEVDCSICAIQGACNGVIGSVGTAESSEACLYQCRGQPGCAWFSYDINSGICDLYETCLEVDEGREGWVSGEASCSSTSGPSSTTTTLSPTTTTATTTTTTAAITEDYGLLWIDHGSGQVRLGNSMKSNKSILKRELLGMT